MFPGKPVPGISKFWEVDFHSYAHGSLWKNEFKFLLGKDMKKGLSLMEKYWDITKLFVYPYGEYDNRVSNIVKSFWF